MAERERQKQRSAAMRHGYAILLATDEFRGNEAELLALTAREFVNRIIANLPNNSNERVLLERHVAHLAQRQRLELGRPLDNWNNYQRASIRDHVEGRGGGNQGNGVNNNPAPANGNQGNGGNGAPAANVNQGNGGNGAANVLPRFIHICALLAFFCAALGSYSLRDSWMCLLLGQGDNTTHESSRNILGTSPISEAREGEGAGAGGSASTSTEESRDKSINTTAGQSNYSSADMALTVGSGDLLGGSLSLEAGASGSANAGDASFVAGDSQSTDGGSMTIEGGDGPNNGGSVTISAGSGASTGGGLISITSGISDDSSSGAASLKTADAAGSSAGSSSGNLNLSTGSASIANSGDVSIATGLSTSASAGDMALTVGSGDLLGGSAASFVAGDSQSTFFFTAVVVRAAYIKRLKRENRKLRVKNRRLKAKLARVPPAFRRRRRQHEDDDIIAYLNEH